MQRVFTRSCQQKRGLKLLERLQLQIYCVPLARGFADSFEGTEPLAPESSVKLDKRGKPRLHGGRRLRRKEKGSWNSSKIVHKEGQEAPIWPANVPIYDLQTQAPFLFDQFNPVFDAYKAMREQAPEEFAQLLVSQTPEYPPPREGAAKILEWEINVVFDMDPSTKEPHPLNKKVKCRVYLRDLQKEFNLSDDALQCIAKICGPRYSPNKGLLTLTSEKYRDREDNRLHIADMLNELVREGQRMFPCESFKESIDLRAALYGDDSREEQKEEQATA